MAIEPGRRLGPYEILASIGAGGMGEVYRAKDTRLDRTVAVKVLPEHLSRDPARRQRFEREARAVSSLNHPHICTLYDVGSQDGLDYLVMELVEGETLADRLAKGPLPPDQALRYAIQIADALDKAHRQGVVHRDLKPGNVMLTKSGAKLLDFGLAKTQTPLAGEPSGVATFTQDEPLTREGTIVGTLPYMAPEQFEGQEADPRTDLFAFGAVLYEMVTGRRAFEGKSSASVMAAILRSDPRPITAPGARLPPGLDEIVNSCLAKDRGERWQSAHDAKLALSWVLDSPPQRGAAAGRPRTLERLPWLLVALFLGSTAIATLLLQREKGGRQASAPTLRFEAPIPEGSALYPFSGPVAVSPDGRRLAYFPRTAGRYLLWVHDLGSFAARPIAGTEGGGNPFWSPDGRWIAFFANGKLMKVDASGGPAQGICDVSDWAFGDWGRDGSILFGTISGALSRVPPTGGAPSPLTILDKTRHEVAHLWPHFLPDGRHFVYLARSETAEQTGVYLGDLDSKQVTRLISADSNTVYLPRRVGNADGALIFGREGRLMAQPFDAKRLETAGDAFPVAMEQVASFAGSSLSQFSVSTTGVLAYGTPGNRNSQLAWFDRRGRRKEAIGTPGEHIHVEVSPDSSRVVVERLDSHLGGGGIWLLEPARNVTSLFSVGPTWGWNPVLSRDGSRIAFASYRDGSSEIHSKAVSGGDDELLVTLPATLAFPTDWLPDGSGVVIDRVDQKTLADLWIVRASRDAKPEPVVRTDFVDTEGKVSGDGRFIAYTSNESGRLEIYVRPFPSGPGKWQISSNGGSEPRWRRDGQEIYYMAADRTLMAVPVKTDHGFVPGSPEPLFAAGGAASFSGRYDYAASADGQRFLVITPVADASPSRLRVVLNWTPTRE